MTDVMQILRPDKAQRTLLSLKKVVRLDSPSVCFTADEINNMKASLLNVSQTTQQLLTILRKLDCYKLELADLTSSGIGRAVATLAAQSPKQEVVRLASSLLAKWRDMVDLVMFQPLADYDKEAAKEAPEGEAAPPSVLIAQEKERQRLEKLERRRQRIEADFMASSSSDDDALQPVEDQEWQPFGKKGAGVVQAPPRATRRSRRGQQAQQLRTSQQMVPLILIEPTPPRQPQQDAEAACEQQESSQIPTEVKESKSTQSNGPQVEEEILPSPPIPEVGPACSLLDIAEEQDSGEQADGEKDGGQADDAATVDVCVTVYEQQRVENAERVTTLTDT